MYVPNIFGQDFSGESSSNIDLSEEKGVLQGRTCIQLFFDTETDDEMLGRLGVPKDKVTELMKHGIFFSDRYTGEFTHQSIATGFIKLDTPPIQAGVIAEGLMLTLRAKLGQPPMVTNLAKLMHPCDTQIFDKDGRYDEKRFKEITELYDKETVDGKKVSMLTLSELENMHQANVDRSATDLKTAQTFCGYLLSLVNWEVGKEASEGELDLAFKLFKDGEKNGQPALSCPKFKQIYTEGSTPFKQYVAQKTSAPSPTEALL